MRAATATAAAASLLLGRPRRRRWGGEETGWSHSQGQLAHARESGYLLLVSVAAALEESSRDSGAVGGPVFFVLVVAGKGG